MSRRYDQHFLELAAKHATMSKDPNTRVTYHEIEP